MKSNVNARENKDKHLKFREYSKGKKLESKVMRKDLDVMKYLCFAQ